MEIFNTLGFGIVSMVIVGMSWCLVGLVMGDAPKKNVDTGLVQFWGAVVSTVASLVILFFTRGDSGGKFNEWTGLCLLLMNPKLMLGSFSVRLNVEEHISLHYKINTLILNLCSSF